LQNQFIDWSFWFHPSTLYLACCVLQPLKRSIIFWLNVTIAMVFSAIGIIATVAAVRQIVLD